MAAQYNFEIEKGSTFYISFEYKDASSNIINLTNYCARLSIQSTATPPTKITYISDSIESGHSFTISPNEGKIILQLSSSLTGSFNFDNAVYDLDLKLPNSAFIGAGDSIIRILTGNISMISRNISEPEPFVCKNLSDPEQCIVCE